MPIQLLGPSIEQYLPFPNLPNARSKLQNHPAEIVLVILVTLYYVYGKPVYSKMTQALTPTIQYAQDKSTILVVQSSNSITPTYLNLADTVVILEGKCIRSKGS